MSGSLLGVELKGIASAPVGYLTILRMYPMDFEEFMIANQVSVATLDMLEEKWKASAPVIPLLASKSSNVFRLFSSDIGLLTSAYPAETKMELINKNGEVNNGAHFENVIAQQFYELKEMLGDDCIEVKKGCIVSVSAIFSYSGFAFLFFLKLQMQYIHVIVVSKYIFFNHVYQVETIRIRLSNSCESDFAKACYLKHILIQEIHALFHTNHL